MGQGGIRIAAGRVTIGEQHDARNGAGGQLRARGAQRGFEVGAAPIDRGGGRTRSPRVGVGELTKRRGIVHRGSAGAEGDDAEV